MEKVNVLHLKAMEFADQAAEARRAGDLDAYKRLTGNALKHEAQAAWEAAPNHDFEPTRSVLFRSAATLAVECGELRTAEQLIGAALSGRPPPEIAEELRDLLEDVYFHRHLQIRGVTLAQDELQMTLDGDAVGFGMARSDAFVQRIKDFENLVYRTAERLRGRAFRDAGRRKKELAESLELYLSVPRAASFAVTLKIGHKAQLEMDLPGADFTAKTMKEVLGGLDLVSRGDFAGLREQIPDEPYRLNFIALAQRLSPDGQDIRTVGFTTSFHRELRVVALATPRRDVREWLHREPKEATAGTQEQHIEIQGTLLEADAKSQTEGVIQVVDSTGEIHKVFVPRGMMSDIVKPMFEEEVILCAVQKGTRKDLETIDLADGSDGTAPGGQGH